MLIWHRLRVQKLTQNSLPYVFKVPSQLRRSQLPPHPGGVGQAGITFSSHKGVNRCSEKLSKVPSITQQVTGRVKTQTQTTGAGQGGFPAPPHCRSRLLGVRSWLTGVGCWGGRRQVPRAEEEGHCREAAPSPRRTRDARAGRWYRDQCWAALRASEEG